LAIAQLAKQSQSPLLVLTPDIASQDRLIAEYEAEFYRPYQAAELGFVDDVIHPRDTRTAIFRALDMLADKVDVSPPKKHGNIPL